MIDEATRRGEVEEKGYWSDESWSDEEEEKPQKDRKTTMNKRLQTLEHQMFPEVIVSLQQYDAALLRTMAVSNIEPSVRLYESTYGTKKHIMAQYLKAFIEKGGKKKTFPTFERKIGR